jgi:hypothetical protein
MRPGIQIVNEYQIVNKYQIVNEYQIAKDSSLNDENKPKKDNKLTTKNASEHAIGPWRWSLKGSLLGQPRAWCQVLVAKRWSRGPSCPGAPG